MGVRFDWEIGDAAGPRRPDAAPPRRRPRRTVLPALAALVLLAPVALLALAGGALWLRLAQREAELDAELSHVVALEAQAVAAGDLELFLSLQDNAVPGWRRGQRDWIAPRARWPAGQPYPYALEIVASEVQGDEGWVLLEETRPRPGIVELPGEGATAGPGSEPVRYRRVAFFRRSAGRWLHAAPDPASPYWGETRRQTRGRFRVTYPAADQAQVAAWLDEIVPLAERACADVGCRAELQWTLTVSPAAWRVPPPLIFGARPVRELVLPSPGLIGYPAGGAPDARVENALVHLVLVGILGDRAAAQPPEPRARLTYELLSYAVLNWELREAHRRIEPGLAGAHGDQPLESLDGELRAFLGRIPADPRFVPLARLGRPGTTSAPSWALYGQAAALAEHVAAVHGRERFGALLTAAAQSDSVGAALQAALGVTDLAAFEREWLARVRGQLR